MPRNCTGRQGVVHHMDHFLSYPEKGQKFPNNFWYSVHKRSWWRIIKWKRQIDVDKQKVMHMRKKCFCCRRSDKFWTSCSGKRSWSEIVLWKHQLSAQERSNRRLEVESGKAQQGISCQLPAYHTWYSSLHFRNEGELRKIQKEGTRTAKGFCAKSNWAD